MTYILHRRTALAGLGALTASLAAPSLRAATPLKIGVLVPDSGAAGLFGPSARNCGAFAATQINKRGGIAGQPIELVFADAGLPPADVVGTALRLVRSEKVAAVVGMHDSAVRAAVANALRGQVPYVYTPVYEGDECSNGVYVISETPQQQLEPVIPWIAKDQKVKSWYLIGNDYIWPRNTNAKATTYIEKSGGSVVGEEYLTFDVTNFDSSLGRIRDSGADAVLVTLVGGASVGFNVSFAQFGLDKQAIRLGTLIEENTLAGIGAGNDKGLYASSAYFANAPSQANAAFTADYANMFGADAAVLNSLGESVLEGLFFLEAVGNKAGGLDAKDVAANANGTSYSSPRGKATMRNRHIDQTIYLAKASSGMFSIVHQFDRVSSGATCS